MKKIWLALFLLSLWGASSAPVAAQRTTLFYSGTYSSVRNYALGDTVQQGAGVYMSLTPNNLGNDPFSHPTQWLVLGQGASSALTGTQNSLVAFVGPGSGSSYAAGGSNIKVDGTGNSLTVPGSLAVTSQVASSANFAAPGGSSSGPGYAFSAPSNVSTFGGSFGIGLDSVYNLLLGTGTGGLRVNGTNGDLLSIDNGGNATLQGTFTMSSLFKVGAGIHPFTADSNGNATANTLTVAADPATNLQVATKQYVDAHAGGGVTGPQYNLPAFNGAGSGSNYAVSYFNAKTDSTGNNLTIPGVLLANQPQGMWSATAYNTGGNGANTNGLQTILANPTYQGQGSSTIFVEPGYTEWEQSPLAIMTGDRRSVFDTREGSFYLLSRNPGATGTHSNSNVYVDCAAHTMPSATFGSITTEFTSNCLWANYKNDVPGYYNGAIDPAQPTGWASATFLNANINFYGAAINKSLFSAYLTAQGAGDQQVFDLHNYDNYGGGDKSADEGHHLFRIVDTMGQAYFVGSVGSVADDPTDDYYTLALNSSNGQIGVLRLLLNTTTGVIADTIQGSSVPGTGGRLITMAASTYPVSKVATLTSGDIAPPKNAYQTKTTASITLSTAIDLSTVTPSLIGQGMMLVTNNNTDSMECMPIQSFGAYNSSTHTQAVTTMANEHHSNGATAYLGGMACKFLVADADVMARTGNNKPTFYILGSTANNTLLVARQVGGSPDSWTPAGGTVHIYNGGRVLDVRDPNGYSTANTLKVERTGAGIWTANDGLYSGMIATSQNDTIYYALTDNNPYSGGSSVLYSLNGAQAGGYGGRDFMRIQNNAHDTDYTYGGGPFSLGYLIHSMGPVGGIFKADLPFHDAFLTQFNCGYEFAKSSAASFAERCANSGRGPNGSLLAEGWDVKGDFEVVPYQNPALWTAIFSYLNGIQLNQFTTIQGTDGPGTASLTVLAPLNGTGVAFHNAGKAQTDGAATFGSTVTTNGQLFATGGIVVTPHNCILGTDLNGVVGCNSNPISGSTFTGTRYDLQYNGTTVGQVTNNLSTFQIQSTNGSTFALAAAGQLRLSANGGTGFGSGGIRFDTYLAGNNGSGMTIRSNSDNGNTGSPLILQVSDYNTNAFQTVLQANGVTTNGAKAGLALAPNDGVVTVGSANRVVKSRAANYNQAKVIVLYGSSVCAGQGASTYANSWPGMLQTALQAKGYTVYNMSISGNSTTDLINRFYTDVAPLNPNIVLNCSGLINDNYDPQQFRRDVLQLIRMERDLGAVPMVATQYANNNYTAQNYADARYLTDFFEGNGTESLDLWSAANQPDGHYMNAALVNADGIHPTDAASHLFFDAIPLAVFDYPDDSYYQPIPADRGAWSLASTTTSAPIDITLDSAASSWTVAGWFKDGGVLGKAYVSAAASNGSNVRVNNNGTNGAIQLVETNSSATIVPLITSSVSGTGSAWHHIAVSFNSYTNAYTLYVDGANIGTATSTYSAGATCSDFYFLGNPTISTAAMLGSLTDAVVYRTSLMAGDVQELYHGKMLRRSAAWGSRFNFAPEGSATGVQFIPSFAYSVNQLIATGTFSLTSPPPAQ